MNPNAALKLLNYQITKFQNSLRVDRHSVHAVRSIQHGFSQGRMGVDGPHQIFHGGFEFHCGHGFGDQLRRLRANDVHAENLAIVRIGNNLDEALMLADDGGA